MQVIGSQGGDRRRVIGVASRRPSNSTRLDNDDGAAAQLTSSPWLLPTHRHPVVVVVTSVASRVASRTFMGQVLCLRRRHRPWDVTSVDSKDVTPPTMT